MTSTTKLSSQLHRIAAQWPADPFRPHIQLKSFMEALADHPRLTADAVRAADAIQSNAIQRRYPLSEKLLRPKAMPLHYARLVEGHEKAAQGIGRPWWKIFFNVW
ncbi:hypothetical protein EIP91_009416 [Steccherinum ochraceum]|uniref:Uncharacterized protein n=1 Tax=Steccherinum ochraceum TaxID=92696 RepID=A0A4R0RB38_9APHY|nr:hypothetical protein EIP91_009416 [Steccherinum ochraceum]